MERGTRNAKTLFMFHVMRLSVMRLSSDKRHQRHDAGFFDGRGQNPLVAGTGPVSFRGINFPLGIHKAPQKVGVFIVYFIHFYLAKIALLFFLNFIHNYMPTKIQKTYKTTKVQKFEDPIFCTFVFS